MNIMKKINILSKDHIVKNVNNDNIQNKRGQEILDSRKREIDTQNKRDQETLDFRKREINILQQKHMEKEIKNISLKGSFQEIFEVKRIKQQN